MHLIKSRRGESKALCPFHNDKDPSLVIYSDRSAGKPHFHCYACGEHGDAIDLVKGVLRVDFKGAMEWLRTRYNVAASPGTARNAKAFSSNGIALGLSIYKQKASEAALLRWLSTRNIEPSTAARAELVFASANTLSNSLSQLSDDEAREVASNLFDSHLIRRLLPNIGTSYNLRLENNYRYGDYFSGDRIVIPIRGVDGTLAGLAARASESVPGKDSPKYMLTRGLKKASHLYNSHVAFAQLRAQASTDISSDLPLFVCEGFFDALRLSEVGLPAVAVMGSSASHEQAKLIRSVANEIGGDRVVVYIIMDDDEAGLRGASQSIKQLIELGLRVAFCFPYDLRERDPFCKDPDCLLSGRDEEEARTLLLQAVLPPGTAILAAEFGADARMLLSDESWNSSPRSRRILAIERATTSLRRVVIGADGALAGWISSPPSRTGAAGVALHQWLEYVESIGHPHAANLSPFSSNEDAKLNHARLLAYKGSRRGELPCDEPRWERLDQAATMFNVALKERLASSHVGEMPPFDAVWVPRSFGKEEPRLKVMPPCEVLTIQQYILNELLSERLDAVSAGSKPFSHCVPAVRYYRESDRAVTTGLGVGPHADGLEVPLSYAYQIDMEVVEGRQPANDQGMFRPFIDCWKHFIRSISEQSERIGFVYTERLDVVRYYDRIRRYVARDGLLPKLSEALESIPSESSEFCRLLTCGGRDSTKHTASMVIDYLTSSLFGYAYRRPDTGEIDWAPENLGIPQGPVASAWIGSIALFQVDQVALEFKRRYNTEGMTRIGYARYVDDIVLLADSAHLLEELKRQVVLAAGKLDLVLLAKAEAIPPMSSGQFSQFITSGRALAVSGPAWEPTLVGDGDSGWEPWVALPETDRQSALQILSDWTLYGGQVSTILRAVRTAFLAPDLRASELAKGARLIWYAVAIRLKNKARKQAVTFAEAHSIFESYWEHCCAGATWTLSPEKNPWELPLAFELEGLDKLLDSSSYSLSMLNAQENVERRERLSVLTEMARSPDFPALVRGGSESLSHQLNRRLQLILWKAGRSAQGTASITSTAELARTLGAWNSLEWMHLAVQELQTPRTDDHDPLAAFQVPVHEEERKALERRESRSFHVIRQMLPNLEQPSVEDPECSSIALQTIVSVAPRPALVNLLSKRGHLLEDAEQSLLLMPPLPGIDQKRLLAVASAEDGPRVALVREILAYEPSDAQSDADPFLLGAENREPVAWPLHWAKSSRSNLEVRRADASGWKLQVLRAPHYAKRGSPRDVAGLYRAIVRVANRYADEQEDRELVPSWSSIAVDDDGTLMVINEGVLAEQLTNKAFIRNGERGLRTVEVPIYEARLWRAGIAVSDYFGYIDDLGKYGEVDDAPLDDAALSNIGEYVVNCQLRKLRGEYADSTTSRRIEGKDQLPISVERSLRFLEAFPEVGEGLGNRAQIAALLANEADLAAMRIRYTHQGSDLLPTEFLRRVADRVVGRLPAEVGQKLELERKRGDLRSDLAALLPLAKAVHRLSPGGDDAEAHYAWRMLQAGMTSSAIALAFQGLAVSLRSQGEFALADVELVPGAADDQRGSARTSAVQRSAGAGTQSPSSLIKDVLDRVSAAAQSVGGQLSISEQTLSGLSQLIGLLDEADQCDAQGDWPFFDIGTRTTQVLTLEVLDGAIDLVTQIDSELRFLNVRVVSPSYGYDAQSRRFRDHKDQEWELQPWMIGQYPSDRKVEEILEDGRVLKVWTETIDLRSQRLISISVAGRALAKLSAPAVGGQGTRILKGEEDRTGDASRSIAHPDVVESAHIANDDDRDLDEVATREAASDPEDSIGIRRSVREGQRESWQLRRSSKNPAHVRVAVLQSEQHLSYFHPMMEVHPRSWPISKSESATLVEACALASPVWEKLDEASSARGLEHLWVHDGIKLPSWHEYRRRRLLKRAIDACEALGVELLMLPEYSVREETVKWLERELQGKTVAILAGTYKTFRDALDDTSLQAVLTLLWPVPDIPARTNAVRAPAQSDLHDRVLVLSRPKKYRSVGLSEHIRPGTRELAPLFNVGDLVSLLSDKLGLKLSAEQASNLLTGVALPLKHFAELVCSEVFALTSPLNFQHIQDDYQTFCRKFGFGASNTAVAEDVMKLGKLLAAGSSAASSDRRSVLMVPAATTRTADYWLTGQASLLAGGTTTVFCNGTGDNHLKGGSCFIGRASWTREHSGAGYIPTCTPYHGWSKGIFYNNSTDALSEKDQAIVVADIDPYNMIEGKPRPQMLPIPLQLVAYLPIVETIDSFDVKLPLCKSLAVDPSTVRGSVRIAKTGTIKSRESFWNSVMELSHGGAYKTFAEMFSDHSAVSSRIRAFQNDGYQLPHAVGSASGLFSSPALYDWLDVDLTFVAGDTLPDIDVPSWGAKPR